MRKRAFAWIVGMVMLILMGMCSGAWAISYTFQYDDSVSPARNRVAEYAYEIFNYRWVADDTIKLHKQASYRYAGTKIRGIPYVVNNGSIQINFEGYKKLIQDYKNGAVNNGLYDLVDNKVCMKYGMACAEFVTDCLKQGFSEEAKLANDGGTCFHFHYGYDAKGNRYVRGNWYQYVSSVSETFHTFDNSSSGYYSAWDSDFRSRVRENDYEAYKKLKRGDYLFNYEHVVLVIDNDVSSQVITYIDQTPWWDDNNDVGTHIGTRKYSTWSTDSDTYRYIPVYVDYPEEVAKRIPIDAEHFPDIVFRAYLRRTVDTNGDGYLSQREIDAVTDMWEDDGPHPDNSNPDNGNYGYEWIKIESIEGIKIFKNLKNLCVYRDNIKEIDLSGMEHLERLHCYGNETDAGYGNKLTKLNLENCSSLVELWCQHNQITELNLKGCKALTEFWAHDNKLTSLNVEGCTSLKKAFLWNNSFTGFGQGQTYMQSLEYLNLAGCSSMTGLNLSYYKNLKELYINGCSSLEFIYADQSPITNTVNTSGCDRLKTFDRASGVKVTGTAPTITTSSLPNAFVGKSYSATIKASGTGSDNGRIFFSIDTNSDAYSNGLRMRNYTGSITGTPKQENSSLKVTVTASNYVGSVSKTFTIKVIAETAPTITTTSLPDAYISESYYAKVNTIGTTPITFTLDSVLPQSNGFDVLSWMVGSCTDGVIKGTPGYVDGNPTNRTPPYTVKFPITATNAGGSDSRTLEVTVYALPAVKSSLKNGSTGQSYSDYITVEGGKSSYTWTKQSGTIPPGLSMSPSGSSLYLTGTPTKAGTYDFTLKVKDANGKTATKSLTITITQPVVAPTITTTSLKDGTAGESYSETLSASGTASISWSATGLPYGLSCSSAGKISGTPTSSGTFSVKVTATNTAGNASKTFTLTIYDKPSISSSFKNGTTGQSYSDYVIASGGKSSYTWTKQSGTIPPGLSMSPSGSSLYLKGTPTTAGTYSFTLKVADAKGKTATKSFTITITQPVVAPTITTTSLPAGKVDEAYSATLSASGTTPITWTATGLPGGLSCSSAGRISGTPTAAGTFTVSVTATNTVSTSKTLTLTIEDDDPNTSPEIDVKIAPEFKNFSIMMEGTIGMNFYVYLPEIDGVTYTDKNCWMEFDIRGDTSNVPQPLDLSYSRTINGIKCYRF